MKITIRRIAQTTVTIYLVGLCVPSAASGGVSGGVLTSLVPLTLLDSSVKQTKAKPPAKQRKPKPPPPDNDGSRRKYKKPPKPPPERKKPPKYKPPPKPRKPDNPHNRKPREYPSGHEKWPERRPLPPPDCSPPRPIIIIDPVVEYVVDEYYYYYDDDPRVPTLTLEEHNLLFTSLAIVTNGLLAVGPKRSTEVAGVGVFFGITSLAFAVAPGSEHRGWDLFFGAASLFFAAMNARTPAYENPDDPPLLEYTINF